MTATGIVILLAAFAPVNQTDKSGYPPLPTFHEREDYIAWYENALAGEAPRATLGGSFGSPGNSTRNKRRNAGATSTYQVCVRWLPGMPDSKITEQWWPKFEGMLSGSTGEDGKRTVAIAPWGPTEHADWEASYKRTAEAIQQYEAAARLGPLRVPTGLNGELDDATNRLCQMNRDYLRFLHECALGTLEAAWRIDGKRPPAQTMLAAIETNLRIARHLEETIGWEEHRAALSIRQITYEHVRQAFSQRVLRPIHARKLVDTLREIDAKLPDLSTTLPGEAAVMLDTLQYAYGPSGGESAKLQLNKARFRELTGEKPPSETSNMGARYREDPVATAQVILEACSRAERRLSREYQRSHVLTLQGLGADIEERSGATRMLFKGLSDRWRAFYLDAIRCETQRRGTHLLVEILAYKQKKGGRWPKRLTDLSRETRRNIGNDPFSGAAFVYQLDNDEPLLYSVSTNSRDDGGHHDPAWCETMPNGDFVFWPVSAQNTSTAGEPASAVPLAAIGPGLEGKTITVVAEVVEVDDDRGHSRRRRYVVALSQGETTIDLVFYGEMWSNDRDLERIRPGTRIRAEAVVQKGGGRFRLKLTNRSKLVILD